MLSISLQLLILCYSLLASGVAQVGSDLPEIKASTVTIVDAGQLDLHANEAKVYWEGRPFSGTSLVHYSNGQVAEEIAYVDGKRDGYRRKYFEDGTLSYESNYKTNRLNGTVKTWWRNGALRSEGTFENGIAEGVQQQWYTDGQLFKELHLSGGKEEGLQRAWRNNGKLYVNYEAKNGRIFGLKRASLCFELSEENIITE